MLLNFNSHSIYIPSPSSSLHLNRFSSFSSLYIFSLPHRFQFEDNFFLLAVYNCRWKFYSAMLSISCSYYTSIYFFISVSVTTNICSKICDWLFVHCFIFLHPYINSFSNEFSIYQNYWNIVLFAFQFDNYIAGISMYIYTNYVWVLLISPISLRQK